MVSLGAFGFNVGDFFVFWLELWFVLGLLVNGVSKGWLRRSCCLMVVWC